MKYLKIILLFSLLLLAYNVHAGVINVMFMAPGGYHFYDTFTGTNGTALTSHSPDIGPATPWESGSTTWTIQSNTANNNPGLEASLVDAGADVFTSGTYAWVAYGTNTLANVGNELEITYVNSANGAYWQLRNIFDLSADLAVGKKYLLSADAYYSGGAAGPELYITDPTTGVYLADFTGVKTTYTVFISAKSATLATVSANHLGASNKVYIDNLSVREVTMNEQFATDDLGITGGIFDVNVTIPATTNGMAGLVLCLDDKDTPANFIEVYYNRGTAKVEVWKCVAGTYTNLDNDPETYATGATLQATLAYISATDDVTLTVIYNSNETYSGTIEDNSVAGNTRHGIMNTDTANSLDNFDVTQ